MNSLIAALSRWFALLTQVAWLLWETFRDCLLVSFVFVNEPIENQTQNNNGRGRQQTGDASGMVWVIAVACAAIVPLFFAFEWIVGQSVERKQNIDILATACIAAFTAVQATFAVRQWHVMANQLTNAQEATRYTASTVEQMRIERRAWVPFLVPMLTRFNETQPIECNLRVRNTGDTPALVERQQAGIFIRNRDTADFTDEFLAVAEKMYSQEPFFEMVLPPGDAVHEFGGTQHRNLTWEDKRDIEGDEPTRIIVVVGILIYRDIYDVKHGSVCCFKYRFKDQRFMTHRKYNYMT